MAVSSVASSGFWNTTKKVANTYGNFCFGVGQNAKFAEALQASIKQNGTKGLSTGIKEAYEVSNLGGSFWGAIKKAFTPSLIKEEWQVLSKEVANEGVIKSLSKAKFTPVSAETASKIAANTVKGAEKGLAKGAGALAVASKGGIFKTAGKFLGKRMPLIGNLIALAVEVPNVVKAFTDKEHGGGFGTGVKETGKAIFKTGMFALGSLIGGLVPVPGLNVVTSIACGALFNWVGEKIVGESFSNKVAKAEAAKTANADSETKTETNPEVSTAVGATNASSQYSQNMLAYNQISSNPFAQQDYMDKDFMAMCAGLG